MKHSFWIALFLLFSVVACKQDPKTTGNTMDAIPSANVKDLSGHWIALDFCFRTEQYNSVLGAMNNSHLPYAYALTFDPAFPDSVTCYNGIERWKLGVNYNVDTLELKQARAGKSVYLVYDSQHEKTITMFDATMGSAKITNFSKSKSEANDALKAFRIALNHNLLSGVFSTAGSNKIQFVTAGYITGWPAFDKYEVCINGDCFVAGDAVDVITLSNSKKEGSEKMYGLQYNVQGTELSILNLAPPANADEKGGYTVKGVAYKLTRKKTE